MIGDKIAVIEVQKWAFWPSSQKIVLLVPPEHTSIVYIKVVTMMTINYYRQKMYKIIS